MAQGGIAGSSILIVEDEYFIANDARSALSDVGANVLGPVASVDDARRMIDACPAIDGVLLDINLRGEMAFTLADTLLERGIPFAFVTGYDREAIPPRFAKAASLLKPVDHKLLIQSVHGFATARQV
jgi:CheY-like chemotaxis protein